MTCSVQPSEKSPGGFDCDTEFVSGVSMTSDEIIERARKLTQASWIVLTGGEPLLQVDAEIIHALKVAGYNLALETNGTKPIPEGVDWVCVSPKIAEHAVIPNEADEVKYVRAYGQGIPQPVIAASHYYLSPAFDARETSKATLDWCVKLCLDNPVWRLSVQNHNLWNVR